MKKENGVYVDFYVVKDGMHLPIKTMNLRDFSRNLTESVIGSLECIISPKSEEENDNT